VDMGSPAGITWMDILIPFGISFDMASVHKAYRRTALRPRVSLLEEFSTLFNRAITGLPFNIHVAMSAAFETVIGRYLTVARSTADEWRTALNVATTLRSMKANYSDVTFYVNAQFKLFAEVEQGIADEVLLEFNKQFEVARKAYRDRNGVDWCVQFRRKQALIDFRWLVFVPEQFMPLGNTTPDLHQVAEMLVARSKAAMRAWATFKCPDNPKLHLARRYDKILQENCVERNKKDADGLCDDIISIRKSIQRMWVTCQIVAAQFGQRFQPSAFPRGVHLEEPVDDVPCQVGTEGRFPTKENS